MSEVSVGSSGALENVMVLSDRGRDSSAKRAAEPITNVEYRRIESEADREAIYELRYRAYIHEGAITPRPDSRLTDRFDNLPNSWIFGVYFNGELASSIRVSVATIDNPETPAVEAFGDLLRPELAKGKVIVDPNRFVADPVNRNRFVELPYLTVRLGYLACGYFNADIGTATVRAEHRAFYRRVFLQTPLCDPRPYPTLVKPLCLMAADYPAVREKIFERYPHFRSTHSEQRALFERHTPTESGMSELNILRFPLTSRTLDA